MRPFTTAAAARYSGIFLSALKPRRRRVACIAPTFGFLAGLMTPTVGTAAVADAKRSGCWRSVRCRSAVALFTGSSTAIGHRSTGPNAATLVVIVIFGQHRPRLRTVRLATGDRRRLQHTYKRDIPLALRPPTSAAESTWCKCLLLTQTYYNGQRSVLLTNAFVFIIKTTFYRLLRKWRIGSRSCSGGGCNNPEKILHSLFRNVIGENVNCCNRFHFTKLLCASIVPVHGVDCASPRNVLDIFV